MAALTDKVNVRGVNLIDIQAAILTAKGLLPLFLVTIAHHINDLVPTGRMEQDVRDFIILGAVTVILNQYTKIIHNAQVFVNDVLLGGTGILCSDDVQLLGTLCDLEHKLKQPHRSLSGSSCSL